MSIKDKATLQALWVNGFIPQGSDYSDWIQSQVNTAETSAQALAGSLSVTKLITNSVSGANVTFGGFFFNVKVVGGYNVSASNVNMAATSNVTVSAGNNTSLYGGSSVSLNGGGTSQFSVGTNANLSSTGSIFVTAANNIAVGATGTVTFTANNLSINSTLTQPIAIVSAFGTTQATAALVSATVVRCKGVADGATTGFKLVANKPGLVQYLYSDSVSANLWPQTGGTINALGSNAAFAMAANTPYVVMHLTASAYAVK